MAEPKNTKVKVTPDPFLTTRARRHCFTWFNYTVDDISRLKAFTADDCNYICWGHEICPDTQKPHLQGYVEWDRGISGAAMLKKLLGRKKLNPCPIRGSVAEKSRLANIRYCEKQSSADDNYPVKFCEIVHKVPAQGKRTDIYDDLIGRIEDGTKFTDLAREFPEQAVKHTNGIKVLMTAFEAEDTLKENQDSFKDWRPRVWQNEVIKMVSKPSENDRNIFWFSDPVGGRGKTKLADYLELFHDAEILENGSTKDVVHGWQMKPVVIFDLSRSQADYINYGVIESIKNNRAFSGKYDSRTKRGRGCNHVIVFANWPPDTSKMSADRFIIRHLDDADCEFINIPVEDEQLPINELAFPVIVEEEEGMRGDNISDDTNDVIGGALQEEETNFNEKNYEQICEIFDNYNPMEIKKERYLALPPSWQTMSFATCDRLGLLGVIPPNDPAPGNRLLTHIDCTNTLNDAYDPHEDDF